MGLHKMEKSQKVKTKVPRELSEREYLGLIDMFKSVIEAHKEYAIVKEQEETKRLAISYDLTKYLDKMNLQKELLEKHLKYEFHLRSETIVEIFARLDTAIDNNSEVIAVAALNAIYGIVASNPMAGLAEIKKIFEDDGRVLEI